MFCEIHNKLQYHLSHKSIKTQNTIITTTIFCVLSISLELEMNYTLVTVGIHTFCNMVLCRVFIKILGELQYLCPFNYLIEEINE